MIESRSRGMTGPQSAGVMISFSLAMVIGIWVTLVVCLRNHTGEPLISLLLLLLAPFPQLLFCQPRGGPDMPAALQDGEDAKLGTGRRLGVFIFSALVTLSYGIVFLMMHNYRLTPWWAAWAAVGTTCAGVISFIVLRCATRGGCT